MSIQEALNFRTALEDFKQARRKAALQELVARLTGRSTDLLAYEDVRKQLRATNPIERGLQEIPVDAIVGSVGRYKDFSRSFLPKNDSNKDRWARVKAAVVDSTGLPPIEVYQIGQVYFVKDGNHRVSVARQLGVPTISAYVTEVKTRVPLTPEDDPDEVICKARYVEFLEKTDLDRLRPGADLLMTFCGHYRVLLEHIDVHRYFMGLDQQRDISYSEAVVHWYDTVYLPVIALIREQGILHEFPERTEADLYVLVAEHRAELAEVLGWDVDAATAATDLVDQKSTKPGRLVTRMGEYLLDAVLAGEREEEIRPGPRLKGRNRPRQDDRLFADILVAINGTETGWRILDQALTIAHRESSRLLGLHVVPDKTWLTGDKVSQIQAEFEQRVQAAGVVGVFTAKVGPVVPTLVRQTAWVDLLVLPLNYPPGTRLLERISSNLNTLLQRSPRPVLTVPTEAEAGLDRVLLAYDGSPKGDEALYVATYLAVRWQVALAVITVESNGIKGEVLERARGYLEENGVEAEFILCQGDRVEMILAEIESRHSNLLVMGGFGSRPVLDTVLGKTVNEMLRLAQQPLLICR